MMEQARSALAWFYQLLVSVLTFYESDHLMLISCNNQTKMLGFREVNL